MIFNLKDRGLIFCIFTLPIINVDIDGSVVTTHQMVHINSTVFVPAAIHDYVLESSKLCSPQQLGKKIAYHFVRRAVADLNVSSLDAVDPHSPTPNIFP